MGTTLSCKKDPKEALSRVLARNLLPNVHDTIASYETPSLHTVGWL